MIANANQRTNGPVNAHLESATYTNIKTMFEYCGILRYSPSAGTDEALVSYFFRIINNSVQLQFPLGFSLQMTRLY